jgi:Ion channel
MPGASLLNSIEQARRDGFHGPVRQPREQGEKAIMGLLRRQRSEILLCGLVAQIVISPLADSHPAVGALLAVITLLLLLTGATYIANRQIVRFVGLPIAAVWLAARALEAFGDGHRIYAKLAPVAGLALSCFVLWALLKRFQSLHFVTRSLISEAFINYLVIAIAFSQLYWILSHFVDHSFNQLIPPNQGSAFLYFSMITLTSVGYGGIVPVDPYVRFVAAFESMTGVFYLAVIVAHMVSCYRRKQFPSSPPTLTR